MTGTLVEVVIFARNVQAQVEFYRDVIGLPVKFPPGCDSYYQEPRVTLDAGPCLLSIYDGGTRRIGEGMPRIIFAVNDIHAIRERMLSIGLNIGPVRQVDPDTLQCDGFDPEGNPLSLESRE